MTVTGRLATSVVLLLSSACQQVAEIPDDDDAPIVGDTPAIDDSDDTDPVEEPPAAAATVEVQRTPDGWQLLRNGAPYRVNGAGFGGSYDNLDLLADAGANAIRTWSAEDGQRILDEADARGLTVLMGIWIGLASQGFDYSDAEAVAAQLEGARETVLQLKDHPALLAWGVGNEVEIHGESPEMWAAIEGVSAMIHEVDPNHPTVVVTADVGEANDQRLRELVPSADIWGINAYGSLGILTERLDDRGWDRPILITEFGPRGGWEVPVTDWGAPREANPVDKALDYRNAWNGPITRDPRSLGSFAFYWGNHDDRGSLWKPLDTWYTLLTPSGGPLEPTETLRELWGGQPSADPPPRFQQWSFTGEGQYLPAGAPLEATLRATDDEALSYTWVVHRDSLELGSGAGSPVLCEEAGTSTLSFAAPTAPGPYRVLGVARDPAGGGTLASGRFYVEGSSDVVVPLPLRVDDHFAASGWMGDAPQGGLTRDSCERTVDYCAATCHTFTFRRVSEGWSGVVWHSPVGNWSAEELGVSMAQGAIAVTFTAWGAQGGESISFFAGNESADEPIGQTEVVLGTTPTTYRMVLTPGEADHVSAGFGWSAGAPADPTESVSFHVADIQWVAE